MNKILLKLKPSIGLCPGILLFGLLGVIVSSLLLLYELDMSFSRNHQGYIGIPELQWNASKNDAAMGLIAFLMSFILLASLAWSRFLRTRIALQSFIYSFLLISFFFTSGFLYLYASRGIVQGTFIKAHDAYHYYLGPKYYKELGYFGLYEATIIADTESAVPVFRNSDSIRDLDNYETISVREAKQRGVEWKDNFSVHRWNQFKKDVEFFKTLAPSTFTVFLRDHGYNGTPCHAYISGFLANLFVLNYRTATLACLIDIIGLLIMFIALSHGFGWKSAVLVAIFFFTSFTDRFYYIGGSFFRYWWMIPLGFGLSFLRRRKYFFAAFSMASAGMLNVFPLFFMGGMGLKVLRRICLHRKIPKVYLRFIWGALAAVLLLGALSISHAQGISNYSSFLENMSIHTELATRSRIGLRYLFLLPNELLGLSEDYGYRQKAFDLQQLFPYYTGVGLFILLLLSFLSKRLSETESCIIIGVSTCLLLFNTVEYYYGFLGFLLLVQHRGSRSKVRFQAACLYFGMAFTYLVWSYSESYMICNNYLVSAIVLFYLLDTCIFLLHREARYVFCKGGICSAFSKVAVIITSVSGHFMPSKKVVIRSFFFLSFCLLCILFGVVVKSFYHKNYRTDLKTSARIVFGGDVCLGRRQHILSARDGMEKALGEIDLLRNADISIVNLECVVARVGRMGTTKGESGPYYFRARPEMLGILEKSGIDIVVTANNHSGDYGPEALMEQITYLNSMGMGYAGSGANLEEARTPVFRRAGNIVVAIIGMDTTMPHFAATENKPGNHFVDPSDLSSLPETMPSMIAAARNKADLVFVAIHWGANYQTKPDDNTRRLGHTLIEAGADGVLGTSSHMIQGVEIHNNRPIIYDAGNLLFDFSDHTESGLFELRLWPGGVKEIIFHPLEGSPGYSRPALGEKATRLVETFCQRSRALGTSITHKENTTATISLPIFSYRKYPKTETDIDPPQVSAAPVFSEDPPPGCMVTINDIPENALLAPHKLGDLEIVGLEISPKKITKREMLYITTYWRLSEGVSNIPNRILLDIRAVSAMGKGGGWSGAHEPCDWSWTTDNFIKDGVYKDFYGLRPPSRNDIKTGTLTITANLLDLDRKPLHTPIEIAIVPVETGTP